MKLINETKWSTRDLRKIILRACKQRCFNPRDNGLLRRLQVFVRPGRSGVWGCAYLNGGPLNLYLRRDGLGVTPAWLAQTVCHEMDHVRGLTHKDMIPLETYKVDWAKALPLRLMEEPSTEKLAALKRVDRLKIAYAKVAEWTRKLNLAKTKLAKWTKKLDRAQEARS